MADERILERVRKMLDRANHPNTPDGERQTCIAMADAAMQKHAIDQAMLDAAKKPNERRKPTSREFTAWDGFQWRSQFYTIMTEIARTVGVRASVSYRGTVTLVGMSDDIDYCEMLWMSVYLNFSSKLEPKWNNDLSFEHNVYNFKEAGSKWPDIRIIAVNNDCWVDWPDGGRLKRAYQRHCKILGEEPRNHTQRHDAYRQSFADAYERRLCHRLEELRSDRKETAESSGAALVLYDVKQEVDAAYYVMFPDEHPDVVAENNRKWMEKHRADRSKEQQEREEMLAAMTDKQRQAFLDKEERKRQREAERNERYWENEAKRNATEYGGARAGRAAADSVDLSRRTGVQHSAPKGEL